MSYYRLLANIFFIVAILQSCQEKQRIALYQDPYKDSFRGKAIQSMLSYDDSEPSLKLDSIIFNKSGDMIYQHGYMRSERREYDSLKFVTRLLQTNDVPYNYLVKYSLLEDTLVQTWIPLKTKTWEFKESDILTEGQIKNYFILDDRGRVEKELLDGSVIDYKYRNELLVIKEQRSLDDNTNIYKWEYFYKNAVLELINEYSQNSLILSHYYEKGLLDSTVHYESGFKYIKKYKYY